MLTKNTHPLNKNDILYIGPNNYDFYSKSAIICLCFFNAKALYRQKTCIL